MRRMIFVPILIFLALAAIAGGIAFWIYDNYTYYRTDDAQVTGQIVNISAPAAGMLTSLSIKQGDTVTANETIGTITLPPTQGTNGATAGPTTLNVTSPMNGTVLQVPVVLNHIDAYRDTSFTGHVNLIVQAAAGQFSLLPNQDPTSGNFTKVGQRIPVVITLDGTSGKDIVPGMSAEATIHLH